MFVSNGFSRAQAKSTLSIRAITAFRSFANAHWRPAMLLDHAFCYPLLAAPATAAAGGRSGGRGTAGRTLRRRRR
jgi:hypothetical protein